MFETIDSNDNSLPQIIIHKARNIPRWRSCENAEDVIIEEAENERMMTDDEIESVCDRVKAVTYMSLSLDEPFGHIDHNEFV